MVIFGISGFYSGTTEDYQFVLPGNIACYGNTGTHVVKQKYTPEQLILVTLLFLSNQGYANWG